MYASKIEHEWNGHLEIFRLPLAIENSREFFLLQTDIIENSRWVPLMGLFGCSLWISHQSSLLVLDLSSGSSFK